MRAGIDSHKRTLAVAIVDDAGRRIQVDTFANDPRGHLRLGKWLVEVGFDVREVLCGFTVRERRRLAGGGKSDPIDALGACQTFCVRA